MASGSTNFPTSLDSNSVATGATEITSTGYNNHSVQIEALEAKVGADSSAVTTSHDYKLGGVTGSDKAVSLTGSEVLTNKTLTSPLLQGTVDGWISANATWTYASATTITVPSGAASKYAVGDRIKLTQTTVKYFVVTGVADTVLTVTGGSDYSVANAAISANYYSHVDTPVGFPSTFSYTPTFTNFTIGNGTITYAKFMMSGKKVSVRVRVVLGSSSAMGNTPELSLPVTSATYVIHAPLGFANLQDTGTNQFKGFVNYFNTTNVFFQNLAVTGSNITGGTITSTVPFTWTTSDEFHLNFNYEAA